jgi:hypothetical protein
MWEIGAAVIRYNDLHPTPARFHLFLKSLEGAFVSYFPEKRVFLDRKAQADGGAAFEVALCRECGQHYLVGRVMNNGNRLVEAIRDPGHPEFGAAFFRPTETSSAGDEEEDEGELFSLCIRCGEIRRQRPLLPLAGFGQRQFQGATVDWAGWICAGTHWRSNHRLNRVGNSAGQRKIPEVFRI